MLPANIRIGVISVEIRSSRVSRAGTKVALPPREATKRDVSVEAFALGLEYHDMSLST